MKRSPPSRTAGAKNRVRRDVKAAYFDLGFVDESLRLAEGNRRVLEQYLRSRKRATA